MITKTAVKQISEILALVSGLRSELIRTGLEPPVDNKERRLILDGLRQITNNLEDIGKKMLLGKIQGWTHEHERHVHQASVPAQQGQGGGE